MATNKKRITISLDDEQAAFIKRASTVLEKPQSSVIIQLIEETIPVMEPMIEHIEAAKMGKINQTQLMSKVLKDVIKKSGDAQLDLINNLGGEEE